MSFVFTYQIFLCLCFNAVLCASADSKPNIVFVLADDLGYADIGYNGGGGQIKTPVLDKLAKEGVRLDNYYVQPLCTPSRSALLTGKIPIHTGLQHIVIPPAAPYGLPLELPTIPEKLKEVGYDTHMIGKWHLGMYKKDYLPQKRGFDNFYGYYQGAEDYFTHRVCGTPIGQGYCGLDLHNGTTPDITKNGSYSAHVFTDEAIRLIRAQSEKSSPMFMYLAYQNVHQPQQVPEQYESQYQFIENKQRRTLAGQVSVLDEAVGNVTQALKDAGLWKNTIFIFSSDNGGPTGGPRGGVGCNYPLRGSKGTVWEGGVRVAGFVTSPLMTRAGEISREWMHISDWYPTILGLAGVSTANTTLDGYDQWPAITGTGHSPRKELLYNIDPLMIKFGIKKRNSPFDNRQQAALRVGDLKIITGVPIMDGWYKPVSLAREVKQELDYEDLAMEETKILNEKSFLQNIYLFNITADPYERNDLSKEMPEVVDALLTKLAAYAQGSVPPLNPPQQLKQADPGKHGDSWEPWQ